MLKSSENGDFFFRLPKIVENLFAAEVDSVVTKSITCARFLQSALQLCPYFHKCCSFNNSTEDWLQICDLFNRSSYILWRNWLEEVKKGTEKHCSDLSDLSPRRSIQMIMVNLSLLILNKKLKEVQSFVI